MTNSLFADRLKAERKRLALSQSAAAAIAGVSREMFCRYERGALPGADVLIALGAGGFDVGFIVTGKLGSGLDQLAPDEVLLLKRYRQASQVVRTALDAVLTAGEGRSAS